MRPLELVSMAQNGHTEIAAGSEIQEAEHSYWWSTNPVLFSAAPLLLLWFQRLQELCGQYYNCSPYLSMNSFPGQALMPDV